MRRKKSVKEKAGADAPLSESDASQSSRRMPNAGTIERLFTQLAAELPLLDMKILGAVLAEVKARPRASHRYLFKQFNSADPARRAVASRILARSGSADVMDELNAAIFDADQEPWIKILANDLLAELGSPVDPDVFAMSVPQSKELQAKLPSRVLRLLADGDTAAAVEHARTLHAADRSLIIYEVVAREKERALGFLEALAADDEASAAAVVCAIGMEKLEAAVPLLLELQRTAARDLAKLIKKTFFEMRKAGIEVPEEEPSDAHRPAGSDAADGLTPYRMKLSEPTARGSVLAVMAWRRPNGRL